MTTANSELAVVQEPAALDEINETIVTARATMPAIRGAGESLQPQTFAELTRFADYLAKSDAVPKSYQGKPHAIVVAGLAGAELGLSLMKALQGICVINGVPSLYGKTSFAMVSRHQDFDGIEEWCEGDPLDEAQDFVYHVVLKRRGRADVHRSFSKAEAKSIKVQSGGNKVALWEKPGPWADGYKARMCRWRAFGFAAADQFADALLGFGIVEEMIDVTPGHDRVSVSAGPSRTAAVRETITQTLRPVADVVDTTDVIVQPTRTAESVTPSANGTASNGAATHAEPPGPAETHAGATADEPGLPGSFESSRGAGAPPIEAQRITADTVQRIKGAVDYTTARTLCNLATDAGLTEDDLTTIIHEHTGQFVLKKGPSVTAIINAVRARSKRS